MTDRLSFADAANELENLCQQIDETEENLGELVSQLFNRAQDTLKDSIDRRIKFIKYAESQIIVAKDMRDEWAHRAQMFEKTIEYIKENTKQVIKMNPGLPMKGNIGGFKLYKNSMPSLHILPGARIPDQYWLYPMPVIDKVKMRDDLKKDIAVEGAFLEYGEHVRIGLEI